MAISLGVYPTFSDIPKCCLRISPCCSPSKKLDGANQRPQSDRHQHWFCSSGIGGDLDFTVSKAISFHSWLHTQNKITVKPQPHWGTIHWRYWRWDNHFRSESDGICRIHRISKSTPKLLKHGAKHGARSSERSHQRCAPGVTLLLTRRSARRGTSKAKAVFWGHSNCDPGLDFFQSYPLVN